MQTNSSPVTQLAPDGGLVFGCDYNPEQWDEATWAEDVRLMREAGVNLVAINIFGWAELQPDADTFAFDRLDAVMDLLSANGIGVNLGTGTSSPPPWLTTAHPEILPVTADGATRWPGGRQAWCPSSPVFRSSALRLVEEIARRYGSHPALRLWHVSNELGCHNALCYCDTSADAFRRWLQDRYPTLDALNAAWGTAFWSQRYSAWEQILPPRTPHATPNPTQVLDFRRFSSDELLGHYRAETAVLRALSSIPVTTNFMVTAHIRTQNYWQWAPEMDVIANDHYPDHRLDDPVQEIAFAADLTRGLARSRPWLLMEHATSAVNWQPRNIAKAPGELLRNSLAHLARGADGLCFFQWRASLQGSEKFHSAMLPHAGTDSKIWREVTELGDALGRLREVAGSTVTARAAVVFSWEAWWACDGDSHPSSDLRYLEQVHALYGALWDAGITADFLPPDGDFSAYDLVLVPALYLVTDDDAARLTDYVRQGGTAVISFFSGIVDENERVRPGGYPGAFRDLLGVRVEEFHPLAAGRQLALSNGTSAELWSEALRTTTAEAVLTITDGHLSGTPAVTRNSFGNGTAWYLGTALGKETLLEVLSDAARSAGIPASGTRGVETIERVSGDRTYLFLINHTTQDHKHRVTGTELVTGTDVADVVVVPAGSVRVVRTIPTGKEAN